MVQRLDNAGGPQLGSCEATYDYPVLDYGRSMSFGDVTCASGANGVTCSNPEGRWFLVSRAKIAVH